MAMCANLILQDERMTQTPLEKATFKAFGEIHETR